MKKLITTILIFLASSVTYAADTPVGVSYRDFSGGLNNFSTSVSLQPNESPNLLNVVIDEPPGALTQRNGYQTCGSIPSGNTATNLYEFSRNDGRRYLIATDNRSIWSTENCASWVLISTGLLVTSFPRFATINNNLWIVNGTNYPIVWDGVSTTTLNGTGGLPLAPITKYISFWKSRVWLANSVTDPSGIYFSALVDDQGNILDPATSPGAWSNINNLIYFDRDNGSPIYGIKVYRDNMYVFKENNIDRLVFESEFVIGGISTAKSVSTTGSKFQESIIEMDDGILRFLGRDGVYRFDGSTVQRISTKWTPTFYSFKQPSHSEKSIAWATTTDFAGGTFTQTLSTQVNIPSNVALAGIDFHGNTYSSNPVWTKGFGTATAANGYLGLTGFTNISTPYTKWNKGIEWETRFSTGSYANPYFTIIFSDLLSGDNRGIKVQSINANSISLLGNNGASGADTAICSVAGITLNQWGHVSVTEDGSSWTLNTPSGSCTGTFSYTYPINYFTITEWDSTGKLDIDNINGVYFQTTGTYTSAITNIPNLTMWKTFDVTQTLNGQTIAYSVRTATSSAMIATKSWNSIISGSGISSSSNTYIQWKADYSTNDNTITPLINSIILEYSIGDVTLSPVTAISYKSRYWLSASTNIGNNYNDIIMVENKTMGASVPGLNYTMFNIPASAFTLWNNNLYAAISNTPNIARLDYGQTDDVAPITSYWQSRDEIDQNPLFYKTINKQIADFATVPSNPTLKVGLSSDMGANWQFRTVNTGAKLPLPRATYVVNPSTITMSLQYRSEIYNNTPGIGYTIYGLHNFGTSTDYFGGNN